MKQLLWTANPILVAWVLLIIEVLMGFILLDNFLVNIIIPLRLTTFTVILFHFDKDLGEERPS